MVAPASSKPGSGTLAAVHAAFLSILPRIATHARVYFRHVTCPAKKADRVAEAVLPVPGPRRGTRPARGQAGGDREAGRFPHPST